MSRASAVPTANIAAEYAVGEIQLAEQFLADSSPEHRNNTMEACREEALVHAHLAVAWAGIAQARAVREASP